MYVNVHACGWSILITICYIICKCKQSVAQSIVDGIVKKNMWKKPHCQCHTQSLWGHCQLKCQVTSPLASAVRCLVLRHRWWNSLCRPSWLPEGMMAKKKKKNAWCVVRKESGKNQRTRKSWNRVPKGWQNSEIKCKVVLCIDIGLHN